MAPGAPLIGGDAAAAPSSPIDDELLVRSDRIVTALNGLVEGTVDGRPLRGEDLIAVADQIRELRDALAFADAIGPLT